MRGKLYEEICPNISILFFEGIYIVLLDIATIEDRGTFQMSQIEMIPPNLFAKTRASVSCQWPTGTIFMLL